MTDFDKVAASLDRQNREFDALTKLAARWSTLQTVAVVEDDYPEQRHKYEAALRDFISALESNGRFASRAPPPPASAVKLDLDAIREAIQFAFRMQSPGTPAPEIAQIINAAAARLGNREAGQ